MRQSDPAKVVQLLDLLLACFDGGRRWTQMRFEDGNGGRCLVRAMDELCLAHAGLNRDDAATYLVEALPQASKRKMGLIGFNDRVRDYSEVAQLIKDARALAQRAAERQPDANKAAAAQKQQEAEARKRQLLAELERERMVRHAVGDIRETYTLSPRPPAPHAEPQRLAA